MEVIKGRMYDYNNGRFLSVDPFISSPTSTQALNPYTYIFNNPLSGTDPSGYIPELTNAFGCNTTFTGGCAQDNNIFARANNVRNHAGNQSSNNSLEKFATQNNAYVNGRKRGRVFGGAIEEIEGQNLIAQKDPNVRSARMKAKCEALGSNYPGCSGSDFQQGLDNIKKGSAVIADELSDPLNYVGGAALSAVVKGGKLVLVSTKVANATNKLSKPLRNKLKRIRNQSAAGGNRAVSGSVSYDESLMLGEEFVGSGFKVSTTSNGLTIFRSSDGLRQFRLPSAKKGINPNTQESFSKTGFQVNFESRVEASGRFINNVHLDVDL